MLLSRKSELTLKDSTNFYYRRIKRIVPLYVFIITLTIIASYNLITDYDVGQIFFESIPALLFYSNLPFVHKTGYFDMVRFYQNILLIYFFFLEVEV
jgi:peptidoglycan/LPS O-acetylase OafA/YrhL